MAISFILGVACIFSMGFVIASIINNSKAATAVANVIYFPMLFLSGATIPIETMPDTIKDISKFIPLRACSVSFFAHLFGKFCRLLRQKYLPYVSMSAYFFLVIDKIMLENPHIKRY